MSNGKIFMTFEKLYLKITREKIIKKYFYSLMDYFALSIECFWQIFDFALLMTSNCFFGLL